MPLKAKVPEAEFAQLGADVQTSYEKAGETYYYVGEIPDVDGLKTALNTERTRADTAEKALKPFEGVDPARFKVLDAADKARVDGKDERATAWQTEKEQLTTQIGTLTSSNETLSQENIGLKKGVKLRTLFKDSGVIEDRLDDAIALTGSSFALDGDNLKGPEGVDIKVFASDTLRKAKPWLYSPAVKPGTGAVNQSTTPARVVSASDQAALNSNIEGLASGAVVVGG
jgi:hypothetical protein